MSVFEGGKSSGYYDGYADGYARAQEVARKENNGPDVPFQLDFRPYCKGCVECKPCINGTFAKYGNGISELHNISLSCQNISHCEYVRRLNG